MDFLKQPELLYVALVLPSLFALTLIAEGVDKILKKESGWVSILLGAVFMVFVVGTYFFLLQ